MKSLFTGAKKITLLEQRHQIGKEALGRHLATNDEGGARVSLDYFPFMPKVNFELKCLSHSR